MIIFRSKALKSSSHRTEVALRSESSQEAIRTPSEPELTAAIKPSPAQPVEPSSTPPRSPAPVKIERFYYDHLRAERWRLFLSSLPLSFVIGLGFYLFFMGAPQWLVSTVMLIGFIVFGLAGFLIEQRRLKEFACPRCESPIEDWETNETHRILFHCAHCDSSWDIEFKPYPEPELQPSVA